MGKKKKGAPGDDRMVALLEMEEYKSLFERAILAQKVTHYPARSRRGLCIGGWSQSDLKDIILEAHLWPSGSEYPPFNTYSMEKTLPANLLNELLANPPTEPAKEPELSDHSRAWVCYLCHQPPALDSEDYDALLADKERYRTMRGCPVFRAALAAALLDARNRARELSAKHRQRFTLDRYGRLIVPALPAPKQWINRSLYKGDREERYAIGDIDEHGYQLLELRIEGNTPEARAALRAEDAYGGCFCGDGDALIQRRIIADVAQLTSRWVWAEPADGERVPYTRVPHGGIVQVLKRGKPGDFVLVQRDYDAPDDGIENDAVVVYRRGEALPDTVLDGLNVKKTARRKGDEKCAAPPVVAKPLFGEDSLFSQVPA